MSRSQPDQSIMNDQHVALTKPGSPTVTVRVRFIRPSTRSEGTGTPLKPRQKEGVFGPYWRHECNVYYMAEVIWGPWWSMHAGQFLTSISLVAW